MFCLKSTRPPPPENIFSRLIHFLTIATDRGASAAENRGKCDLQPARRRRRCSIQLAGLRAGSSWISRLPDPASVAGGETQLQDRMPPKVRSHTLLIISPPLKVDLCLHPSCSCFLAVANIRALQPARSLISRCISLPLSLKFSKWRRACWCQ